MRIPLLADSYDSYAKTNSSRRLVNFYLEQDSHGKSNIVAMPMPGYDVMYAPPTGQGRGIYYVPRTAQSAGRWFAVVGNSLYELFGTSYIKVGPSLASSTGIVVFTHGVGQLCFIAGGQLHVYSLVTGAANVVTTPGTDLIGLTFLGNSIYICNRNSFWVSAVNDATSWDALDFATPESNPDSIRAMVSISGQMKFLGDRTVEVWRETGDLFPLQRAGNTFSERGCIATYSAVILDNSTFWLGEEAAGGYVVWKAEGYNPVRISTHGLENAMRKMPTVEDAIAYGFMHNGHSFYVISFPTANQTYIYDVATGIWSEWLSWSNGGYGRHRGVVHAYGNGEHRLLDWETGAVYRLNQDAYTDGGNTIRRMIRTSVANADNKRQFFRNLQIDVEPGQGLITGQGSDPQMMVKFSDDGGISYDPEMFIPAGKIGQYRLGVHLENCGSAFNRVIEIAMSDPIKWVVLGATMDIDI